MRIASILCILASISLLAGCESTAPRQSQAMLFDGSQTRAEGDAPLAASLFKSDQAVMSNEDITRILSADVHPPAHSRIAVVRIGGRYPMGRTWWSQSVAQIEEEGTSRMLKAFTSCPRVAKVMVLPTMLTPAQVTVPYLREAAARVQADSLLVYRTFTQSYQQQQFFGGGDVHAYCTVEAILLDTRTGTITDTSVKTRSFSAPKTSKDLEMEETIARAEQTAIAEALGMATNDLAKNLSAEPIPSPVTRPMSGTRLVE